jgi:hypothetical protein
VLAELLRADAGLAVEHGDHLDHHEPPLGFARDIRADFER